MDINNDYVRLLSNIENIHTTELGKIRINNNLQMNNDNIVDYLRNKIQNENCLVYKKGKNYYCEIQNIIITVNSYNYCIITAHILKK